MEITGLPLHPLVIHAAVVLTPLAVAFAILFAVLPRWRYLTRWPAVVLTVVSLGAVWMSRLSGNAMVEARPELEQLVRTHEERGELLSLLMIGFTVIVLVAAWTMSVRSGFSSGAGERVASAPALDKVMPLLLVAAGLVVLVWTVLTGDAGARAVWG